MSSINNTTLTEKGERLLAKAETGTLLKYTRIQVGDGQMSGGQTLLNMTAFVSPVANVPINYCRPVFEGVTMARVSGVFDNSQVSTTFMWREVGIFAMDPDDGEILYAYGNAGTEAERIDPATAGGLLIERTVEVNAIIGRAENISAVIDPGASVSNSEFNQYVNQTGDTFITINNVLDTKVDRIPPELLPIPFSSDLKDLFSVFFKDQFENITIAISCISVGSSAVITTGKTIATIPAGYRPSSTMEIPVNLTTTSTEPMIAGSAYIQPDGAIKIKHNSSAAQTYLISSSIVYRAVN